MHWRTIVGHADHRLADEGGEFTQRRLAGKVDRRRRKRRDLAASGAILFHPDQTNRESFLQDMPRYFGETVRAPLLGLPIRARRDRDQARSEEHTSELQSHVNLV